MIREDEPVGRRECAGAAASAGQQANGRVAQPVEILGRQLHAVLAGHELERQLIDPPHPLVCEQRRAACGNGERQQ